MDVSKDCWVILCHYCAKTSCTRREEENDDGDDERCQKIAYFFSVVARNTISAAQRSYFESIRDQ